MKTMLKSLLATSGYRVQGTRCCPRQLLEPEHIRAVEFDDVVCRHMFECGREIMFIQVGAYDGITLDPLRKYNCQLRLAWRLAGAATGARKRLRDLYADND